MSLTILIWAMRLRRWSLDRQLARHVKVCPHRLCRTADLDNCDENSFCRRGRRLFNWSFDLTFEIQVQEEIRDGAKATPVIQSG